MFHIGYFNAFFRFKVTIFVLCDHRSNIFQLTRFCRIDDTCYQVSPS